MSEVKEKVIKAIGNLPDSDVQKIWLFISNGFRSDDWDSIPVVAAEPDEKEILAKYHSGDPEYQPTISQEEVLSQLGITL